jgi:hypothetical protein
MALGAQPEQIRWLILRHGITQLAIGLVLALAGTYAVGRILKTSTLLFETDVEDPVTLISIVLILAIVAVRS